MSYEPAPFLRRLAARILDLFFGFLLAVLIAFPVGALTVPVGALTEGTSQTTVRNVAIGACYVLAYLGAEVFLLIRRNGQTLGKGLLGLRVVPAAQEGRPRLGFLSALVRMLIVLAPFAVMSVASRNPESGLLEGIFWAGLVSIAISLILAAVPAGGGRTLHDLASGTRVVRADTRPIRWTTDIPLVVPGRLTLSKQP